MQAFETNYGKLIDYVKAMPDDLLNQKRAFLSEPIPVSDILANIAGAPRPAPRLRGEQPLRVAGVVPSTDSLERVACRHSLLW